MTGTGVLRSAGEYIMPINLDELTLNHAQPELLASPLRQAEELKQVLYRNKVY